MKKLSLIVAMAVILTIGGVFATWTYSGSTVDTKTANAGIGITAATTNDSKAGTIYATTKSAALSIDNKAQGEQAPDYKTRIDSTTGYIEVDFDAADLATDAVKDGVELAWSVSITGTQSKYNDTITLLTVKNDATESIIHVIDGPVQISAADIAAKLSLAEVELKSREAHGKYAAALETYTIVVTVRYVDDTNS